MTTHGSGQVKELAGRVALVTGGAVRVGLEIARTLADAGADVAIGYLRSAAAARAAVRELEARGVRAVALRADVGRPREARALVTDAVKRLGRLDVLVNNAALFFRTPVATTTPAQFDRLLAVNLRAPFFCSQAAALAPRIQVNAVAPGVVLLPAGFPRERGRRLAVRIPMGRPGRPADVAEAVRFFATCSDYVTGQVLFVDGGMSVR